MIKAKFRDHVRSKTPMAMVNEVLCKIICHTICVLIQEAHELGIDTRFVRVTVDRSLILKEYFGRDDPPIQEKLVLMQQKRLALAQQNLLVLTQHHTLATAQQNRLVGHAPWPPHTRSWLHLLTN
jgi:hypothetical protein